MCVWSVCKINRARAQQLCECASHVQAHLCMCIRVLPMFTCKCAMAGAAGRNGRRVPHAHASLVQPCHNEHAAGTQTARRDRV